MKQQAMTYKNNPEIQSIVNTLGANLDVREIYLFGSWARGDNTPDSDFDFYLIYDDDYEINRFDESYKSYKLIDKIGNTPSDLIFSNKSKFETEKHFPGIHKKIFEEGVKLYG